MSWTNNKIPLTQKIREDGQSDSMCKGGNTWCVWGMRRASCSVLGCGIGVEAIASLSTLEILISWWTLPPDFFFTFCAYIGAVLVWDIICPWELSICLSIYLSVYLPTCLPIHPWQDLSFARCEWSTFSSQVCGIDHHHPYLLWNFTAIGGNVGDSFLNPYL